MSDLIDELVGITPGDRLDLLRAKRPTARGDAQQTYDALITRPADLVRATGIERAAIGAWVAGLSRSDALTQHYIALLSPQVPSISAALQSALSQAVTEGPYGSYPPGPLSTEDAEGLHWTAPAELRIEVGDRLAAALEHAHLLTFRPRDAGPEDLEALLHAGWSTDGIVTVSQLIAFTHFQHRVIAGLIVLKEAI